MTLARFPQERTPRRRARWLALGLWPVLLVAGCAAAEPALPPSESAPSAAPGPAGPTGAADSGEAFPLDAYGFEGEEALAMLRAEWPGVQECLIAAGVPGVIEEPPDWSQIAPVERSSLVGIFLPEAARAALERARSGNEHAPLSEPDYTRGKPENQADADTIQGCRTSAESPVSGWRALSVSYGGEIEPQSLIAELDAQAWDRFHAEIGDRTPAVAAWAECLGERGYTMTVYDDEPLPVPDLPPDTIAVFEANLAQAECGEETGVRDELVSRLRSVQDEVIRENAARLAPIAAERARLLEAAATADAR
ncbi:hypothetical protein [Leucobacter sp. M11]|uniref:hypothetical protein n=1 Tax=Leucobacter sp. M11 TaxID=2993565 RepID=UPI002D7F4BCE|nr:hypothetical protein [Leucobacter sp. M11]MEB4616677.1 hypothetical protein [Leucobacter sp. M11]